MHAFVFHVRRQWIRFVLSLTPSQNLHVCYHLSTLLEANKPTIVVVSKQLACCGDASLCSRLARCYNDAAAARGAAVHCPS